MKISPFYKYIENKLSDHSLDDVEVEALCVSVHRTQG